ncbi:YkvA family protein [Reichenbachiella ulvae]|uniref:YkvA family protein n=1 Tax=Reichenbachiella ulvae TaxID=2980104 RepID=A0ABT3CT46_9BACT|nr:YkvA family protein [Reichenbachiella ulvae]MCV9386890.1 YkvA family protein [Reichenbachiella ulvae]
MNKEKVFKKYKEKAKDILSDNERFSRLMDTTSNKLQGIVNNNDKLKELVDKLSVFLRMVKAQFTGQYRELPWRTLLLVAGGMLYFVTPLDLIPDFLPALGFTDDLAIIFWIYNSIQEDIERFQSWENTLELEVEDES